MFYLRCNAEGCGEVFDSLETATDHMAASDADKTGPAVCFDENNWSIIPEDEAF